jgi:hypothetical protein
MTIRHQVNINFYESDEVAKIHGSLSSEKRQLIDDVIDNFIRCLSEAFSREEVKKINANIDLSDEGRYLDLAVIYENEKDQIEIFARIKIPVIDGNVYYLFASDKSHKAQKTINPANVILREHKDIPLDEGAIGKFHIALVEFLNIVIGFLEDKQQ